MKYTVITIKGILNMYNLDIEGVKYIIVNTKLILRILKYYWNIKGIEILLEIKSIEILLEY